MSRLGFPLYILLSTLALSCSQGIYAQDIAIPLGNQGEAAVQTPYLGWTQSEVQENFGAPLSRKGPIGDPAITIWQYAQFSVYFEQGRVIHSVKHYATGN